MSEGSDWKEGARAEYRSKRADLQKKIAASRKAEARATERRVSFESQLEDLEAGARAFGLDDLTQSAEEIVVEAITMRDGTQVSAKDIILEALAESDPAPMKAKALRAVIEAKLGREVHYKTPGMTLYRLAEEGLVRRDFHDWYLTDKGKLSRVGLSVTLPIEDDDEPSYGFDEVHMGEDDEPPRGEFIPGADEDDPPVFDPFFDRGRTM